MTAAPAARWFRAVAESAHAARDFAREVLAGSAVADDADLCVTELVANAVDHSRSGRCPAGLIVVSICPVRGGAVIRVRDAGGPSGPVLAARRCALGEHGRGLVLVDALAAEWGSHPEAGGRVTWCRLEAPRPFCPESLAAVRPTYCDPAACCRAAFAAAAMNGDSL